MMIISMQDLDSKQGLILRVIAFGLLIVLGTLNQFHVHTAFSKALNNPQQNISQLSDDYRKRKKTKRAERPILSTANQLTKKDLGDYINACFNGFFKSLDGALAPSFIVGDFNGDHRQDLFVTVQLQRKVMKEDKSKPSFELQAVLDPSSPSSEAVDFRVGDLASWEGGPFILLVHSAFEKKCDLKGNRRVLLIPIDKDAKNLRLYSGKKLPHGTIGDPSEDQPPPTLKGNAILLLNSEGDGTALYWDGERYRWYPFNPSERDYTEVRT